MLSGNARRAQTHSQTCEHTHQNHFSSFLSPRNNSLHTINTIILHFVFFSLPFSLFLFFKLFYYSVIFSHSWWVLFFASFFEFSWFILSPQNEIQRTNRTPSEFTKRATVVNSVCLSTDLVSYPTSLYARASKFLFSLRLNVSARARERSLK